MPLLSKLTAAAAMLGLAASAASGAPAGYAVTPFGLFPAECVHHAGDGFTVHNADEQSFVLRSHDGSERRVARCASALKPMLATPGARGAAMDEGDGWQAYAQQKIGTNSSRISKFNGQWTVPAQPDEEAQTLFSFTGVQNNDWVPPQPRPTGPFDILQPVLQYGSSAAGSFEAAWSIASWYVTLTNDVVYSTLKKVPATGTIVGIMERVPNSNNDEWFCATIHQESGISSNFTLSRTLLNHQPWAFVTMEVYDVDDCAQYPAAGSVSSFTKLDIEVDGVPFTPTWEVGTQGQQPPVCGSSVRINSPASVDLIY